MTESPRLGTLYCIGLGPGDPELVTVKAARLLGTLEHVFAPKADARGASIALGIASRYLSATASVIELVYPMTRDRARLEASWRNAAEPLARVLTTGGDVGFVTLGDPSLYSTSSYLLRALLELLPNLSFCLVPAVTSFSACAARTGFVLGEGSTVLTIAPAPKDEIEFERLTALGGRLVLMKIGSRLPQLVAWLAARNLCHCAHWIERVGLEGEQIHSPIRSPGDAAELELALAVSEADPVPLQPTVSRPGYLSTLLIDLDAARNAATFEQPALRNATALGASLS